MYVMTICRFITRNRTGVIDIGHYWDVIMGWRPWGRGNDGFLHCNGTVDVMNDWLKSRAIRAAKAGATRHKNQAGRRSRPRQSMLRISKTIIRGAMMNNS
jgi:hypothetical protein